MKTFFVVTLYTAMVAALDLGGAVLTRRHAAQPAKAAPTTSALTLSPAKMQSAVHAVGTIPSDT